MSVNDGHSVPITPYEDWTGKRVLLKNKKTNEEVCGVVSSDPAGKETRFTTDDGREVGAYEWAYREVQS